MHDEPFVIGILNRFLGLDKIKKGL
jgi:hypothetical protein